jgi:glycosyltransferase involved in cell wall biosynthesis
MKIGVNARFLNHPYTGIGQYTRYLFDALASQNPDAQFLMVVPEHAKAAPAAAEFKLPQNAHIIILPEKFPGSSGMRKTYWEQFQLPQFFRKHNVDIMHFPYPSNPWHSPARSETGTPTIVTVHDVIPWVMPEYRRRVATRLYQDRCKNALKSADRILTVSEASKFDVISTCQIPESKITVIYNGVAPQFLKKIPTDHRTKIIQKYGINPNRPFFLYTGGYDERKNVRQIIDVFIEKIAPNYEIDLVLAGGKSLQAKLYESFDYLTKKSGSGNFSSLKGKLITTGFVDEEDFPALYQSCYAFLSLSKKEGFNLPLLEAAVSGSTIICSNIPVHHEVVDKAAIFCDQDNETALAEILTKLITDQNFYSSQKNLHFSSPFSWDKSAREVMNIYNQLI